MIAYDQLLWIIAPVPRSSRVDELYEYLEPMFGEFDISTPLRQAAWIAQSAHETGRYRWLEEIASGDAYDHRTDLGNTPEIDGDGAWFKGRGLFQLTGANNYRAYSAFAYGDPEYLVQYPQLVAEPLDAVRSSGWYWASKGLNEWADVADLVNLTRKINGGLNGYADRAALYKRATYAYGL